MMRVPAPMEQVEMAGEKQVAVDAVRALAAPDRVLKQEEPAQIA